MSLHTHVHMCGQLLQEGLMDPPAGPPLPSWLLCCGDRGQLPPPASAQPPREVGKVPSGAAEAEQTCKPSEGTLQSCSGQRSRKPAELTVRKSTGKGVSK